MATFDAVVRTMDRSVAEQERNATGVDHTTLFQAQSPKVIKENVGVVGQLPRRHIINRGRNTGIGAAYIYWLSPTNPDPNGIYYMGVVPFSQLADIVGVGATTS